jgi:hypothetical protein
VRQSQHTEKTGFPRPVQLPKFRALLEAGGEVRFVGVSDPKDPEISAYWVVMVFNEGQRPHFLISTGNAEPRLFKSLTALRNFVHLLPKVPQIGNVLVPVLPSLSEENDLFELPPERAEAIRLHRPAPTAA